MLVLSVGVHWINKLVNINAVIAKIINIIIQFWNFDNLFFMSLSIIPSIKHKNINVYGITVFKITCSFSPNSPPNIDIKYLFPFRLIEWNTVWRYSIGFVNSFWTCSTGLPSLYSAKYWLDIYSQARLIIVAIAIIIITVTILFVLEENFSFGNSNNNPTNGK